MEEFGKKEGFGEMNVIKHEPNSPPHKGWHLDKRISLAHILATLSMTAALGSVLWALEARVTATENGLESHKDLSNVQHEAIALQIEAVQERDIQLMAEWVRQNGDIIRRLERIEDGVNRHIGTNHGFGDN